MSPEDLGIRRPSSSLATKFCSSCCHFFSLNSGSRDLIAFCFQVTISMLLLTIWSKGKNYICIHIYICVCVCVCIYIYIYIYIINISHSVMCDSLWPHGLQHARPPCPSPTPGVYSNSCPLSQWCHPTISSSVVPFSSRVQSFPVITDSSNELVLHIR